MTRIKKERTQREVVETLKSKMLSKGTEMLKKTRFLHN